VPFQPSRIIFYDFFMDNWDRLRHNLMKS